MPIRKAVDNFDLLKFLYEHFTSVKLQGSDEVEVPCLYCEDHNMSINIDTKLGQCWRCGYKFNLVKLVRDTLGVTPVAARELIMKQAYLGVKRDLSSMEEEDKPEGPVPFSELKPVPLPGDFAGITDNDDYMSKAIRRYLRKRGVMSEVWESYGMGYSLDRKYYQSVIIPITYKDEVVYYTSRGIRSIKRIRNPREEWGYHSKETVLLGYDLVDESLNFVCIGEGPFDAFSLPNGLSPLGKALSDTQIEMLLELAVLKIYLCLDGGTTKEVIEMAERLADHRKVYVVKFPEGTDANDNRKGIDNYLGEATPYSSKLSGW